MSTLTPAPRPRLAPQAGPATWRAGDLRASDWMMPLGAEDAAEIEAALAALGGRAPQAAQEAPLPRLGAVLRQAATQLDTGRGFALLRGLKPEPDNEPAAEALLRVLGAHLGRAVPLAGGGLVQRVESPATGAARWRFHADAADIVALLTLRQPPAVDPAMLVSAGAVHNEMLRRDRAALALLYAPLPHAMGDGRVADLPVFSTASGAFIGRYARDAIEAAQRLPEVARLTAAQMEALDLLDAICAEAGLALRLEVRPGDVLIFNPLLVWKRRAELIEGAAEGAVRQALRLLLVTPSSRALPQGMVAVGEGPGAGMVGG
jgi:hypothetical protein